jgi:hypothetical protein
VNGNEVERFVGPVESALRMSAFQKSAE